MWLFGNKKAGKLPQFKDLIWVTQARKVDNGCKILGEKVTQGSACLAIAHFPSTLQTFQDVLTTQQIPYETITASHLTPTTLANIITRRRQPNLFLALSSQIAEPNPEEQFPIPQFDLTLLERYPTPERDQALLVFAQGCGITKTVQAYWGLDEPLLQRFGGDRIQSMMSVFQIDENTPIESSMLTNSLRNAQTKLQKSLIQEFRANSPEEWFQHSTFKDTLD